MGIEVTLYLRLFCGFGLHLIFYLPFYVQQKKAPYFQVLTVCMF